MRTLPDKRNHDALVEIIHDYEAANALVEMFLFIDGRDLSVYLESGDVTGGGDGVAWSMGATLSTRLENDLENSPVRLHSVIGGIPVPIFRGVMPTYDSPDEGHETDIIAATPGHLLDKISLGEHTEYVGMTPHSVMQDALFRVPLYNRGGVRIAMFNKPIINRIGSDGFEDAQTAGDVLSDVMGLLDILAYDDPVHYGCRVFRNPGAAGEGAGIAWAYDAQGREVRSWTRPRFASPDEQYRKVVVRDLLDDGTRRVWAERDVNHARLKHQPFAGQIFWVDWVAPEDGSDAEATQAAADMARKLAGGVYGGSTEVAFNPLLEPGDLVVFRDIDEDESGRYQRTWRARLNSVSSTFSDTLSTALDYEATLVKEERLPDPPIRLIGASAGNRPASLIDFAIGLDEEGRLYLNTSRTINSEGQRWAGIDDNGQLWVDPDLSEGYAVITNDGHLALVPHLGPSVGFDAQGHLWIDPTRAISPFTGRRWAGINDQGQIWVDPDTSDGVIAFSGTGTSGDYPSDGDYPDEDDYPSDPVNNLLVLDTDLALQ